MTLAILLGIGLLVGITTVLFGFGGGFVAVPVILVADADLGADALRVSIATSALVMVVNAAVATAATDRAVLGRLGGRRALFALLAAGGACGAVGALFVPDAVPRWGFVAYIALTIVDLLLRPGFLPSRQAAPAGRGPGARPSSPPPSASRASQGSSSEPSRPLPDGWGLPIGAVAAFLGVGGSVMTVPMMRRAGMPMAVATSLANPLTLAIATPALVIALALGGGAVDAGGLVGTVDVASALALLAGAIPVIVVLRRRPPRIPEAVHSWSYIGLLVVAAGTVALTR
ncbi:Integral membrane protein [Actinomycetales bacterium JB111]|nr:Integral membrane protein [Actinomycetales bacterium JB111]